MRKTGTSTQKQTAMNNPNDNSQTPGKPSEMKSLAELTNKVAKNGYTESFQVTSGGLHSQSTDKDYSPGQVTIVDFYRFEGESDPADNAILYVIETADGHKGSLVDAYGTYADENINRFMQQVETTGKNVDNSDKPSQP